MKLYFFVAMLGFLYLIQGQSKTMYVLQCTVYTCSRSTKLSSLLYSLHKTNVLYPNRNKRILNAIFVKILIPMEKNTYENLLDFKVTHWE